MVAGSKQDNKEILPAALLESLATDVDAGQCRTAENQKVTCRARGLPKWGMLLRGPIAAPGPNMGKPSCRGAGMPPERGRSISDAEWRRLREVTPPDMCKGCPGTSGIVLKPDVDGRK
jgi:hypothetical protein